MSAEGKRPSRSFSFGLRDAKTTIALLLTTGFLLITGYAVSKADTMQDVLSIVQIVKDPALAVVFFFFGSKVASK